MLLNCCLLAISVSIDSLGIGITYGLKNTNISKIAKIILFCISVVITSLAVFVGTTISRFFSPFLTTLIGSVILVCMGIWIIYQALSKKESVMDTSKNEIEPKVYEFFIQFLGITIQIIRNPISSDLDHSQKIDWKEAIYLGIALSLDAFCVGIGSSIIGVNSFLFPFLVATFQLIFLSLGRIIGHTISSSTSIPENIWSIISGVLLIFIACSKFFM